MTTDPVDTMGVIAVAGDVRGEVDDVRRGEQVRSTEATCLHQLRDLLRRPTDALVPNYHIVEPHRPLPKGAG